MSEPLSVLRPTMVADSIDDYLAECRAKGLRPATVKDAYGWPLRHLLLPWCREHGHELVAELTQRVVNDFTIELRERLRSDGQLLSRHSVKSYGSAITRWLRWAHEEGQVAERARVRGTRVGRPVREVITEQEFRAMLELAPSERDRLILQILWETGMRASELLGLRTDDLMRHDGRWFLRVRRPSRGGGAKDARERLVPFPRSRDLRRWLDGPRSRLEGASDHVFLSRRKGARGAYPALTISGLEQMVRQVAQEAGITRSVHPHLFRHTAITRWRRAKMDPLWIIAVVGHTSLAMLERTYDQTDHRDAYDALASILEKP